MTFLPLDVFQVHKIVALFAFAAYMRFVLFVRVKSFSKTQIKRFEAALITSSTLLLLEKLVRIKSIQVGLTGFLKQVICLTISFKC